MTYIAQVEIRISAYDAGSNAIHLHSTRQQTGAHTYTTHNLKLQLGLPK